MAEGYMLTTGIIGLAHPDASLSLVYGREHFCITMIHQIRTVHDHPVMAIVPGDLASSTTIRLLRNGVDAVVAEMTPVPIICARIGALVRRWVPSPHAYVQTLGTYGIHWDPRTRRLSVHGHTVWLSPIESRIFHALATSPSWFATASFLLRLGQWKHRNNLAANVMHLRRKLATIPQCPIRITNERTYGYRLVVTIPASLSATSDTPPSAMLDHSFPQVYDHHHVG